MATVEPIGATLGARITGVDLSRLLDGEAFRVIFSAYLDRHVVSLPGQRLGAEELTAFSRRLGPLESHVLSEYRLPGHPQIMVISNVTEKGRPVGLADAGTYWHADLSYKARPSRATVVYAVEVPEEGGDTLFVDMMAAYDGLSAEMKARLNGLQAAHDYGFRHERLVRERGLRRPLTEAQRAETPAVVHPVIRTHPESGRRSIYINPGFTVCIEGLPAEESEALMEEVFDHCLRDEYRLRYHWQAGDVVIWDNAAVMHSATTRDLDPSLRRTLWRTIVSGSEPF